MSRKIDLKYLNDKKYSLKSVRENLNKIIEPNNLLFAIIFPL